MSTAELMAFLAGRSQGFWEGFFALMLVSLWINHREGRF